MRARARARARVRGRGRGRARGRLLRRAPVGRDVFVVVIVVVIVVVRVGYDVVVRGKEGFEGGVGGGALESDEGRQGRRRSRQGGPISNSISISNSCRGRSEVVVREEEKVREVALETGVEGRPEVLPEGAGEFGTRGGECTKRGEHEG